MKLKRSKKKIIITIDSDLLEDTSSSYDKYGIDKEQILNVAGWILDCFQCAIHESYSEGAPRRMEADFLRKKIYKQIMKQCSKTEIENCKRFREFTGFYND